MSAYAYAYHLCASENLPLRNHQLAKRSQVYEFAPWLNTFLLSLFFLARNFQY